MKLPPDIHQIRFPINPEVWGSFFALVGDTISLVDAGPSSCGFEILTDYFLSENLDLQILHSLVLTHSHYDHAGGASFLKAWDPGLLLIALKETAVQLQHPEDQEESAPRVLVHRIVKDGEMVLLGGRKWKVLNTPGHVPGLLSLFDEDRKILLATDALQGNGTIDGIPIYSDLRAYYSSIDRIEDMAPEMIIVSHPFEPDQKPFYTGKDVQYFLSSCRDAAEKLTARILDILGESRSGITAKDLTEKIRAERHCRSSWFYTLRSISAHLKWLEEEASIRCIPASPLSSHTDPEIKVCHWALS